MRFQILALAGGGVRGLYTISVLAKLEQILADRHQDPHYNIAAHFDLVAGTSIGGILALGLSSGLNARSLLTTIDSNRKKIFPCYRRVPVIGVVLQILFGLYRSRPLQNVLEATYGTTLLGELKNRTIIPAVNATSGRPKLFKTPHRADYTNDLHYSLVDVGLATSAAPTFFKPHWIGNQQMMDGGLVANGPSLVAYHEAAKYLGVTADSIHVLSIGTMGMKRVLNADRWFPLWGYLTGWGGGRKLIDMTLSANETLNNFIVKQLIGDRFIELDDHVTPDQSDSITLDNASDNVAKMLKGQGEERGQYASGNPNVMAFFEHIAPQPIFYEGGRSREV